VSANWTSLRFGKRRVGKDAPVLVIAEIGINHEGDADRCGRMIERAAASGADAIKLQTIDPERNYERGSESHRMFSSGMLSPEATARMFKLSRDLGVEPFTTVGDFETLEWVMKLKPAGYKISSGLLTCLPIISRIAEQGYPLLMSTGVALPEDIERAVATARNAKAAGIALLQCTSLYPAPLRRLNLANIEALTDRYGCLAGFSDHSIGVEAPAFAVAAGAVIIEKHFSLDPSRPSYDHAISLDQDGFREMVDRVRRAEAARGAADAEVQPDIRSKRSAISRYLGVIAPVVEGEQLNEINIGFLRFANAGDALPASAFVNVIGARATRNLAVHSPLTAVCYRHD
jgi:sialic acid synthase SpsE